MSRPVRMFSIVFNDRYIDWFDRGCVQSLSWPQNREALKKIVGWDIWTTQQDASRVKSIAKRLNIPVEIHSSIAPSCWEDKAKLKKELFKALLSEIEAGATNEFAFLWIAPDSIFGDGSISSILELGTPPNVCVAFAPLRVNEQGFIEAMGSGPVGNPALVKLAFTRLHQGFVDAEATLAWTNSYESGVSWRRLKEGLYAVTHRGHSSYLMQPNKSDAKWFRECNKFGSYDHSFPQLLVDQQRQRVIGSSDAAFVVELTTAVSHTPKLQQSDPAEPDRFSQKLSNHAVNRNVVVIWRAA